MATTTGRRRRGARPRRRPGAAGAALVAGVAGLCLLGSGVARADTGTGTPPLQLGGTPLPAFTGQVLDPS
ncbi:MAG TPA: hypothetical protein VKP11_11515 [Frankiaceae bacterium]|nr:hypothetical protein [Frankiaceae bacterium]